MALSKVVVYIRYSGGLDQLRLLFTNGNLLVMDKSVVYRK